MLSPRHVIATQGTVYDPYVWVTWDRNDNTVTKYEVLRNGSLIGTIGPFTPYDPSNSAHRDWYGTGGTGGYVNQVLADSPVMYYRLEANASSQPDAGPNAINADTENVTSAAVVTQVALASTTGPITGNTSNLGRVFAADASNGNRISIASSAATSVFGGNWSMEIWVKRSATQSVVQYLMRRGTGQPALKFNANNTVCVASLNSLGDVVTSTTSITDTTTWHHILVTGDTGTQNTKIYIDGVDRTGTPTVTNTWATAQASMNVAGAGALANYFPGSIDEVALYGSKLSSVRVLAHYNGAVISPTASNQPFSDTWDKCAYKDTGVSGGSTYTYQVRPYVGATAGSLNVGATISVEGTAQYGPVHAVAAPSGGDDSSAYQAAINAAEADGGIVTLQAGTYKANVTFTGKRLLVHGAARDTTIVKSYAAGSDTPGSSATDIHNVTGGTTSLGAILSAAIQPGDQTATFSSVSGMQVGSVLQFTAPSVGGTGPEAVARGDVVTPGNQYDEISRWEANPVTVISGSTVTFKHPFTQHMPTTATVVRLAETSLGTRHRGIVFENLTVEGVSSTDTTHFRGFDIVGTVNFRLANVRARWLNSNILACTNGYGLSNVEVYEPDHGASRPLTSMYSFNMSRTANPVTVACEFGTAGAIHILSACTHQRTPRAVVRHTKVHYPDNYGCNEHGGGSRDWIFENNWFNLAPLTEYGGVFCGNVTFANSGRGIIRNNRCDGGPALLTADQHSYGIRVLDNIVFNLAQATGLSLPGALITWRGWAATNELTTNYGAAKLTVKRNAVFGSTGRGIGPLGRDSGQFPFAGIRDVVISDNHFGGVSGTRIYINSTSSDSFRFQVFNNTGSGADSVPTLVSGDYWSNNADGVTTYGTRSVQAWEEEEFPWYVQGVASGGGVTGVAAALLWPYRAVRPSGGVTWP